MFSARRNFITNLRKMIGRNRTTPHRCSSLRRRFFSHDLSYEIGLLRLRRVRTADDLRLKLGPRGVNRSSCGLDRRIAHDGLDGPRDVGAGGAGGGRQLVRGVAQNGVADFGRPRIFDVFVNGASECFDGGGDGGVRLLGDNLKRGGRLVVSARFLDGLRIG